MSEQNRSANSVEANSDYDREQAQKKRAAMDALGVRSTDRRLSAAVEAIAAQDADIVAVARIETDYRKKKLQRAHWELLREKENELLKPSNLEMHRSAGGYNLQGEDVSSQDWLRHGGHDGTMINGIHQYLFDKANESQGEGARTKPGGDADIQDAFGNLPAPVRDAAAKWVQWHDDWNGVGLTLDTVYRAGGISRESYDAIQDARRLGKRILSNPVPFESAVSNGKRPAYVYFWAVAKKA